jgi:hypothetical protein
MTSTSTSYSFPPIKRRADGSIDLDHYDARARSARSDQAHAAIRRAVRSTKAAGRDHARGFARCAAPLRAIFGERAPAS